MKLDDLKNLKLTKEQQQALAFAVMILGGGSYGYYNFLFKPRVAKIATLKKELKEEKKLLEEMRASVRKIDEFKRNAERVARDLRVIKKRLPDEERVPEVMKGINKAVKMSGVALIGKFNQTAQTVIQYRVRIDYILASPALALTCKKAKVFNGEDTHLLSDHYPVMAEFEIMKQ